MSPLEPLSAKVSKVVAEIIGAWTRHVLKRATDITTSGLDRLKLALEVSLDDYIIQTIRKTSCAKTLLYRDAGVALTELYTPTTLRHGTTAFTETDFFRHFLEHGRSIICGTAGSGKTIFMRHCVTSC